MLKSAHARRQILSIVIDKRGVPSAMTANRFSSLLSESCRSKSAMTEKRSSESYQRTRTRTPLLRPLDALHLFEVLSLYSWESGRSCASLEDSDTAAGCAVNFETRKVRILMKPPVIHNLSLHLPPLTLLTPPHSSPILHTPPRSSTLSLHFLTLIGVAGKRRSSVISVSLARYWEA